MFTPWKVRLTPRCSAADRRELSMDPATATSWVRPGGWEQRWLLRSSGEYQLATSEWSDSKASQLLSHMSGLQHMTGQAGTSIASGKPN